MKEKERENPYKGFFEKLSQTLPPEILNKLIISTEEDSEDYNKTYLQKVDDYLEQQYVLINKLYEKSTSDENNVDIKEKTGEE
jgi:hypothetical protein